MCLWQSVSHSAKVWDRQTISNAQLLTRQVTIDTAACQSNELRATLVWSEPGFSLGCRRCLLNGLDLFVIPVADPSNVYFPNGLDKRDSLNNAERVIVPDALTICWRKSKPFLLS